MFRTTLLVVSVLLGSTILAHAEDQMVNLSVSSTHGDTVRFVSTTPGYDAQIEVHFENRPAIVYNGFTLKDPPVILNWTARCVGVAFRPNDLVELGQLRNALLPAIMKRDLIIYYLRSRPFCFTPGERPYTL